MCTCLLTPHAQSCLLCCFHTSHSAAKYGLQDDGSPLLSWQAAQETHHFADMQSVDGLENPFTMPDLWIAKTHRNAQKE
jgi:hypothetical protein